jgi:hypothetical protein
MLEASGGAVFNAAQYMPQLKIPVKVKTHAGRK